MNLDGAWKSACRSIFGSEIGELSDFEQYFASYQKPMLKTCSSISGKPVVISGRSYSPKAKFISQDEITWNQAPKALHINDIKDIDSILAAFAENCHYSGNKVLGESFAVEGSDCCFDSSYLKNSNNVESSKFIAHSSYVRDGSYGVFGSVYLLRCNNAISVSWADKLARCFETYATTFGSDLFYCYSCQNCEQAMFSFNLRSKRHVIGNLQLEKDKYLELRSKLQSESADHLRKNKRFPSIFSPQSRLTIKPPQLSEKSAPQDPAKALQKVGTGFETTTGILFGRKRSSIADYEKYLTHNHPTAKTGKSAFGNPLFYSDAFVFGRIPKDRMVNSEERGALEKSQEAIQIKDSDHLKDIISKIGAISLFCVEYYEGNNINCAKSPLVYGNSLDIYSVMDATSSKNGAFCTLIHSTEYAYGCYRTLNSKFCIRCYNSVKLFRCFETDNSESCHDCYFCHNCEGLKDCMFCCNAKGLQYAICNVPVGKEKYAAYKSALLSWINAQLDSKKLINIDIFSAGIEKK